jgi:hypothetical protein
MPPREPRGLAIVRLAGTGLAIVVGLIFAVAGFSQVGPPDTDAYWAAAERLRDGGLLYPATDPNADEVYRYAPWFAWLWVPLLALPKEAVYAAWTAFLVVCSVVTVWPLRRRGPVAIALGALILGVLLFAAGYGNPTPAITAALAMSHVHPIALGVAGSLKIYPLFLTIGMIAERRWHDTAVAWAIAAFLWSPALLYGLSGYVTSPGHGGTSLWSFSPAVFVLVAFVTTAGAVLLAASRSRWAWVGAAAMIALAVPRVWASDLAYLSVIVDRVREND